MTYNLETGTVDWGGPPGSTPRAVRRWRATLANDRATFEWVAHCQQGARERLRNVRHCYDEEYGKVYY